MIKRHWGTVIYNEAEPAREIARRKEALQELILAELSRWTEPGPLLDFGCNFGQFLVIARKAGWTPSGFEPHATAAETARARGFDVRCSWLLEEAGFAEGSFTALTAIGAFCLTWHPFATLETFQRLLKPGGVLAMRLTNKRFILGLARVFSGAGPSRDARISRMLQTHFHSIGLASFSQIMHAIGFDRIRLLPHATVAPWRALSWQTRMVYLGTRLLYLLSVSKLDLSPGVLLFAQKARR